MPVQNADASTQSPEQQGNGRKRKFKHPTIYLDGKPIAILRYGEVPAKTKVSWYRLSTGKQVRRFRLADYIEGLGIKLSELSAVHIYGGPYRFAVFNGKQMNKHRKLIEFSFSQETGGKVRMHWGAGVPTNDALDKIANVALYKKRKAPVFSRERNVLELDGVATNDVPYVNEDERLNGVRVYLDGRLVHNIRRNELEASSQSRRKESGWPLQAYLQSHQIQLGSRTPKSVDLVAGDELAERVASDRFGELTFVPLANSGGKIHINGLERDISAIMLYDRQAPRIWDEAPPGATKDTQDARPALLVAKDVHNAENAPAHE